MDFWSDRSERRYVVSNNSPKSELSCLGSPVHFDEAMISYDESVSFDPQGHHDGWMVDDVGAIDVSSTLSGGPLATSGDVEAGQEAAMRCKWEGCTYRGCFARKEDLERHVKSVHISPGSYPCSAVGCGKVFNRKDNRDEHFRRRHKDTVKVRSRILRGIIGERLSK